MQVTSELELVSSPIKVPDSPPKNNNNNDTVLAAVKDEGRCSPTQESRLEENNENKQPVKVRLFDIGRI